MVVIIKKWFAERIDTPYGFKVWNRELTVEKETEKAYYGTIEVDSVDGEYEKTIHVWVPKKCTMTLEEAQAEDEREEKAIKSGIEYNSMLVEFAKSNGVKGVRKGFRTATLVEKIKAAGLEVPARN